jgi:hypothetical protein
MDEGPSTVAHVWLAQASDRETLIVPATTPSQGETAVRSKPDTFKAKSKLDIKGFGKFLEDDAPKKKKIRAKEIAINEDGVEELGDEIITPTVVKKSERTKAKSAFLKLPKAQRIKIKRGYKARKNFFSYTDWYHAYKTAQSGGIDEEKTERSTAKRKAKAEISKYSALMQPMVIVPDQYSQKAFIADAGSIVKRCDQRVLYRDRMSPVTGHADEALVLYNAGTKQTALGWLALTPGTALNAKPVEGPTFLVRTKDEKSLNTWDALRLKIARTKMTLITWLAEHGEEHSREIREVINKLGGTTVKNEPHEDRCKKLITLILHTEIEEMPKTSSKNSGKSKSKNSKAESNKKFNKSSKKKNKGTRTRTEIDMKFKTADGEHRARLTKALDEFIIKRVSKPENSEGSARAEKWSWLRKGMTLAEYVEETANKGGLRNDITMWIRSGNVKLVAPRS